MLSLSRWTSAVDECLVRRRRPALASSLLNEQDTTRELDERRGLF